MKKTTLAKYTSLTLSLATALTAVTMPLSAVAQTPSTGTVVVIKQVVNDNGGIAVASNFILTVNGNGASTSTATSTSGSVSFFGSSLGTAITVMPGTFSVTESANAGYTTTFSGSCSGSIAAGETRICTVTNNDVVPSGAAARLTVVKQVVNSTSTSRVASDFTITVNGTGASLGTTTSTGSSVSFGGSTGGTVVTLAPGSFSVTEASVAGFAASFAPGCSGTLAPGESRTCTVTNVASGAVVPTLTCSPAVQTVATFQMATLAASGGDGNFIWSAPDITITNPTGSTFRVTYFTPGTRIVTVTSAGQTATCSLIVSGAVITPIPVPPGLPDTGAGGNALENTLWIFGLTLLAVGASALLAKRTGEAQ